MYNSRERSHDVLDRRLVSGDNIHFEYIESEGDIYRIVYERGFLNISFGELSKLFVKSLGTSMYCCTLYSSAGEFQLYKMSKEEFNELVSGKKFKVFIDENVFTLAEYPYKNPADALKMILSETSPTVIVENDSRFVRSRCMQFEEII